jgi:hypothetical protein
MMDYLDDDCAPPVPPVPMPDCAELADYLDLGLRAEAMAETMDEHLAAEDRRLGWLSHPADRVWLTR